jgi:MYXO-CTERM domain-containing protein
LATGLKYAFYYFPGATYTAGVNTIGSQVGGVNSNTNAPDAGLDAMIIPADSALVNQGAATIGDWSGLQTNSQFTAVNLTTVPEPSAALLGAVGVLGLLRRRRI